MPKLKNFKADGLTIFGNSFAEDAGNILPATLPQGADTEYSTKDINYTTAKGEKRSMKLAFVPVKIEGKGVTDVVVNSVLRAVIMDAKFEDSYGVEVVENPKNKDYPRLNFVEM